MTLEAQTRQFAKANPKHNGATWHLWCLALIQRFLYAFGIPPSTLYSNALAAATAAQPLNKDYTKAPIGAFHYWIYKNDGHVGLEVRGGGKLIFMASANLTESLGDAIGFTTMDNYKKGGLPYMGWAMTCGKDGKIKTEVVKPPEVTMPALTPYEIETQQAIIRMAKAKIISDALADLTRKDLCVILCRFADALSKNIKI